MSSFVVFITVMAVTACENHYGCIAFEVKPLFTLLKADQWTYSEWNGNIFSLGRSPKDFLKVCQVPVSKRTEKNVQTTLESTIEQVQALAEAIDRDDAKSLFQVMEAMKQNLSPTIAAIEGAVQAMIEGQRSLTSMPDKQRRCVQRIENEMMMLQSVLNEIQTETVDAVMQLQLEIKDDKFTELQEQLSRLMNEVQTFLEDTSLRDQILKQCLNLLVPQLMTFVNENLRVLRVSLKDKSQETKENAVESAVGLLIQGMMLNAVCHGAIYVDESNTVQNEIMLKDAQMAKNLVDENQATGKMILNL